MRILRFECKLSLDAIARALSLSKGVVAKYVKMVEQRHESWETLASLDDNALNLALSSESTIANHILQADDLQQETSYCPDKAEDADHPHTLGSRVL